MTGRRSSMTSCAPALLTLVFLALSTGAQAEVYDTVIENGGTHPVTQLYVTSTVAHMLLGDSAFGSNMLVHDMMAGDNATLHTTPKNQQCKHDIKIVYADGYSKVSSQIDLCETRTITLDY